MRSGWKKTLKLGVAMAIAAGAMAVSTTPAAADPSDPICFVDPDYYCQYYAGYTWGSGPYRACLHNVEMVRISGYCDEPL